jgi:hypothetical protein
MSSEAAAQANRRVAMKGIAFNTSRRFVAVR